MVFVHKFRKAKMSQKRHFCEISARQKSAKSTNIYQKNTTFFFRNHLEKLMSQGLGQTEILRKSCGNHLEKLQKSRHFPTEIT